MQQFPEIFDVIFFCLGKGEPRFLSFSVQNADHCFQRDRVYFAEQRGVKGTHYPIETFRIRVVIILKIIVDICNYIRFYVRCDGDRPYGAATIKP